MRIGAVQQTLVTVLESGPPRQAAPARAVHHRGAVAAAAARGAHPTLVRAPSCKASAPPDATAEREMGPLMQAISVYPQHPRRDALQVLGPTLTVTV